MGNTHQALSMKFFPAGKNLITRSQWTVCSQPVSSQPASQPPRTCKLIHKIKIGWLKDFGGGWLLTSASRRPWTKVSQF
jgi:hypothetical protein